MADKLLVMLIVLAAAGYATWSLWLKRRWRARRGAPALVAAGGAAAGGAGTGGAACGCGKDGGCH
jgi:hypothetical protein